MEAEFDATVAAPEAYHPWPLDSGFEAESFGASLNVEVDSSASEQEDVTFWKGTGSWADYPVQRDSAGEYRLAIRCQSDSAAQLGISDHGNVTVAPIPLAPGTAWTEMEVTLHLDAGIGSIRIESLKGSFSVNRIRPAAVPSAGK
jgi:hypothetical protein